MDDVTIPPEIAKLFEGEYLYIEREDRQFRTRTADLSKMDIWLRGQWMPYLGDIARVLMEGAFTSEPPDAE
jgi:hypothetical protein